jgi:hypothetical protein
VELPLIQDDHPLRPIVAEWTRKIDAAVECKYDRFQKWADEAKNFYDSDHNFMWKNDYATGGSGYLDKETASMLPKFRMSVNRVFEMVALYGPSLYHTNPSILVTPQPHPTVPPEALGIMPPDPMQPPDPLVMQQFMAYQQAMMMEAQQQQQLRACASIKEHYLNWLQAESNKKSHVRQAITEAIITGMGFLLTEIYNPPGSAIKHPVSRYLSSDDVVFDPDAEYYDDVRWVAIRRTQATWEVERKFQLPPGSLKGTLQSLRSQSVESSKKGREKKSHVDGKSFDLLVYWEVYSKSGFGDRLKDVKPEVAGTFEEFGDYCYLAVSREIPYPLNMPSEAVQQSVAMIEQAMTEEEQAAQQEELFLRVQWPIPFWTDGGWPFARLLFYHKPKEVYPISLIKPVISYLRFINWGLSFLADKAAASSESIIGVLASAAKDLQDQLRKQTGPFKIVELSELTGKKIDEIVSFLHGPGFDIALFNMIEKVNEWFDKGTGLTELLYGMSSTQMRSATEADVRQANTSIRPEDMASQVEDWLSECAMKEMEAARWMLETHDVAPVVGQLGAVVWEQYIATQDVDAVVRDYTYRIEAGSARKPNKANRVRQLNEFAQIAMPMIQGLAMAGQVGPWNALLGDMAQAQELDAAPYLLPPPPMPPAAPPPGSPPGAPADASPQ